MGIIGNSINAATGNNESSTSLDSFLSKFTSSTQHFVDVIDPLTTFDVYIKFYPTLAAEGMKAGQAVKAFLGTMATGVLSKFASNVTGGLLDINDFTNNGNVEKQHNSWKSDGDQTFLTYLLKANMLVGGENMFNQGQGMQPLTMSLGPYVQEVTLPHITMDDQGKTTTTVGEFPINGLFVKPDSNQLIMQIVNTKAALHERIFYPWMREVTLPFWSYASQPYTTATITIDFTKHNDVKYVFYGCRPNQIHGMQGKQDTSSGDNITRQVTFIFDYMTITSSLKSKESVLNKLLKTGTSLLNSATHTIGL